MNPATPRDDPYAQMLDRRKRIVDATGSANAGDRFVVETMRRDPRMNPDVFRVNAQDRTIFALFVIVGHLVSLCLVEWMISTNAVRTFYVAMLAVAFIYTTFLLILVVAVNMSDGDLRIVFNYANLLAGRGRIVAHVGLLWLAVLIVVLAMATLSDRGNTPVVTDDDRAALTRHVEVTSSCVWYAVAAIAFLV